MTCGKRAATGKTLCQTHLDRLKVRGKRVRRERRLIALAHYGASCACCGETQYEFLTIDHINGDGSKHRRDLKEAGKFNYAVNVVNYIIDHDFPEGFQVLCWSCNGAKRNGIACPHRRLIGDMLQKLAGIGLTY